MKKAFSVIAGVLVAASSFAVLQSELTLSISTPGPDTYADGQPVLPGETYLLVYVSQGSSFQGVYTDGALVDPVNNRVAAKAYATDGAKCGYKAVQYSPDLYPAGGSWVIVLLDTRTQGGVVGGLVAGQGVGSSSSAVSSQSTSLSAVGGAAASALSASAATQSPAGTPAPEITAVRPGADGVEVQFKNVSDGALYKVVSKVDLASSEAWQPVAERVSVREVQSVVQGADGTELKASVGVTESADPVRFFKVIAQ